MFTQKHFLSGIAIAAVAAVALSLSALNTFTDTSPKTSCTVTGKDHSYTSKGASKYRVYTSNCGVFEVQDSILHGVFGSADTYGSILTGHSYRFVTFGHRIEFIGTGLFPNIIKATETK